MQRCGIHTSDPAPIAMGHPVQRFPPKKNPLLTLFHPALCLLIKMQNARACRGGPTAIHLTLDIVDTLCVRRVVWMGIQ